jgi:hypothetical protein
MRYDLRGLRSNTFAHLLAAVGIASLTRGDGRIGWDRSGRHAFVETDLEARTFDDIVERGFRTMREDHLAIISVSPTASVQPGPKKSQGRKGRTAPDKDGSGASKDGEPKGLPVSTIAERLDDLRPTAREAVPALFCIGSHDNGSLAKTRAMLGKTRFYLNVAYDEMRLDTMERQGILEELIDAERMAAQAMRVTSAKVGTAFDHLGAAVNMGISQTEMSGERRPHPMVEMLAIEGMKALPAFPLLFGAPRHRGMYPKHQSGADLTWKFPVWSSALDYYEIEDLLADGRQYACLRNDLIEVREFEIVTNGQVQMMRPKGVPDRWNQFASR